MRCTANYNPKCDISDVAIGVAVDLSECFINKVVPSQVSQQDLQYTGIDSPSNIAGRPSDVFEAMEANKVFSAAVKHQKESRSNTPSPTPAPATE